MAWLNLRKKKIEPETPKHLAVKADVAPTPSVARVTSGTSADTHVLRRPHISERASDNSAKGVYVFDVSPKATKPQIRSAVQNLYKVAVERVRTVTVVPKRIVFKGKLGWSGGGKKAYVYLKKGEKIEVI